MHKLIMTGFGVVLVLMTAHGEGLFCLGESEPIYVNSVLPTTVDKRLTLYASAWGDVGESVTVIDNGAYLFSTTNQAETAWLWQPRTKGNHTLTCTFGTNVLTKTLNVTALDFPVQSGPNPPMAQNNSISITPTTRSFGANGGGNSIITSGSGTWTAAVSDPWITLNATSGSVGYPVAYIISKMRGHKAIILILLLTLPTWINMLVRTYAWMSRRRAAVARSPSLRRIRWYGRLGRT